MYIRYIYGIFVPPNTPKPLTHSGRLRTPSSLWQGLMLVLVLLLLLLLLLLLPQVQLPLKALLLA